MAAEFILEFTCMRCGTSLTYTQDTQVALYGANIPGIKHGITRAKHFSCTKCRTLIPIRVESVRARHSGNVGNFEYVNHEVTCPGVITTTVGT